MKLKTLRPRVALLPDRLKTAGAHHHQQGSRDLRRSSRPWGRVRQRILRRDPLCVLCLAEGRTAASEVVDHKIPLAQGGTHEDDNLQGLCTACHDRKTALEQGKTPGGGL
jgi:5-methylcytosine-specific restriction protein A